MNIAFAGKDGRSNGSPTFTCIKKNFMMLRESFAGLTKVFREPNQREDVYHPNSSERLRKSEEGDY